MDFGRGSRAGVLAGVLSLGACFSESGGDGEGSADDDAETTASSTPGESTEGPTSAESSGGSSSTGGVDPDTSSSSVDATADTGQVDASSSSTGEPLPTCECPANAVICESFEGDDLPTGWSTPPDIQPDPTIDVDDAQCGAQSLSTAVEIDDLYSVLVHARPFEELMGPSAIFEMNLKLSEGCFSADTRVLSFALLEGNATVRYELRLMLGGEQNVGVQTLSNGAPGPLDGPSFETLVPDTWIRVALDFEGLVSGQTPDLELSIDAATASVDSSVMLQIPMATYSFVRVAIGPYRLDEPFDQACEVLFDEVRLTPTP